MERFNGLSLDEINRALNFLNVSGAAEICRVAYAMSVTTVTRKEYDAVTKFESHGDLFILCNDLLGIKHTVRSPKLTHKNSRTVSKALEVISRVQKFKDNGGKLKST